MMGFMPQPMTLIPTINLEGPLHQSVYELLYISTPTTH